MILFEGIPLNSLESDIHVAEWVAEVETADYLCEWG